MANVLLIVELHFPGWRLGARLCLHYHELAAPHCATCTNGSPRGILGGQIKSMFVNAFTVGLGLSLSKRLDVVPHDEA